ncbi:hypothetical protein BES34_018550 [Leptospira inadai serovar Lyme]|uniref:Uncharacterized protein n=1 Tax=Leptospira inadai serovar Lyme TaxID=293084 RepID=A0ABX4YE70_9LEPT|nr:hypothetical protein BES34_018550 [Leptospira inadai serovar Lyme]
MKQNYVQLLENKAFVFRGQRSEDRRVRFAHARQKLLNVGKAAKVEERSIAQELQHNSFLKKLLSG